MLGSADRRKVRLISREIIHMWSHEFSKNSNACDHKSQSNNVTDGRTDRKIDNLYHDNTALSAVNSIS